MRKIIILLLFVVGLCAQNWPDFPEWDAFPDWKQETETTDTTITLLILTSTDYGTDSIDVTGSNDLQTATDSTYWLINQADITVTWENQDYKIGYDGWQSSARLPHGLSDNGYIYVGLAAIDTVGDTTAIVTRRHLVQAFTGIEYNVALYNTGVYD